MKERQAAGRNRELEKSKQNKKDQFPPVIQKKRQKNTAEMIVQKGIGFLPKQWNLLKFLKHFIIDINEMDSIPGVEVGFPDLENLMIISVMITPLEGIYANAKFHFQIFIPDNFPFSAPKVRCKTLVNQYFFLCFTTHNYSLTFIQVYHPNIDFDGAVCLNILRQEWSPVLSLQSVIFGLLILFSVRFSSNKIGFPQIYF